MQVTLIAAYDQNKGLGINGGLLCTLPEDMKWFRSRTIHKSVIMGRKTAQSLKAPLKSRKNIVLSQSFCQEGFITVTHPLMALEEAILHTGIDSEVMVIGGGEVYKLFLPFCTGLDITHIHKSLVADTFFPTWNEKDFTRVSATRVEQTSTTPSYDICQYRKFFCAP